MIFITIIQNSISQVTGKFLILKFLKSDDNIV